MQTELAEATEELRKSRPMVYGDDIEEGRRTEDIEEIRDLHLKPEGAAIELIDCVIRILDYTWATWCVGAKTVERHKAFEQFRFESQRPQSERMTIDDLIVQAHEDVALAWSVSKLPGKKALSIRCLARTAAEILRWLENNGHDTEVLMDLKHNYNKGRTYRHGGKEF